MALIGDTALPSIVQQLPLQRQLILYSLLVEEMRREPIRKLFRCTGWIVREAIRIGFKAVEEGTR